MSRRLRRRGPRSLSSLLSRAARQALRQQGGGQSPGGARGEPRAVPPANLVSHGDLHQYHILLCNIRSLRRHSAELFARVEAELPDCCSY